MIEQVKEFTCLTPDEVIIVLSQNQWSRDKFESKWFDNPDNFKIATGLVYNKTLNIPPTDNKNCGVCFSQNKNNFFGLSCNHKFCNDCWKEYLENKIADKLSTISTTCMQNGCNLFVPQSVFENFLNNDMINLYYIALIKSFTEQSQDIKWCPNSKCGKFIKSSNHTPRSITCDCKTVYCFKCQRDGHEPCDCLLMEIWEKKNRSDGDTVKWLQANTKQCPSCRKHIEKNQGCNHMTCRKEVGGCGYEFCWICMGEWKPHGSDWYNCNKFDPNKQKQEEKDIQKIKTDMQKFSFYFERSFNHNKSLKITEKLRIVAEQNKTIL